MNGSGFIFLEVQFWIKTPKWDDTATKRWLFDTSTLLIQFKIMNSRNANLNFNMLCSSMNGKKLEKLTFLLKVSFKMVAFISYLFLNVVTSDKCNAHARLHFDTKYVSPSFFISVFEVIIILEMIVFFMRKANCGFNSITSWAGLLG